MRLYLCGFGASSLQTDNRQIDREDRETFDKPYKEADLGHGEIVPDPPAGNFFTSL